MGDYQDILQNRALHGIRINKFLADHGLCSRREADTWVEQGRIQINGKLATPGTRIQEGDQVALDGKPLPQRKLPPLPLAPFGRQKPPQPNDSGEVKVYLALNKPVGIVSTTQMQEKHNIIDFLHYPIRIFPVGRLDKDSSGLILLTNDGDIVNRILRARHHHEKEYIVEVDRPLRQEDLEQLSKGVPILDTVTLPCRVWQTGAKEFHICLTQGLNRQIRRMAEALGYQVIRLKRIRILNITLGKLQPGQWRYLSVAELGQLESLLEVGEEI